MAVSSRMRRLSLQDSRCVLDSKTYGWRWKWHSSVRPPCRLRALSGISWCPRWRTVREIRTGPVSLVRQHATQVYRNITTHIHRDHCTVSLFPLRPQRITLLEEKTMSTADTTISAAQSGSITLGGDITVHRLGFGAMRITGKGVWGEPRDRDEARSVLRRAVELQVNFIDTADSYGP